MDYFCLTPVQNKPLYECHSVNPWVTYILNSVFSYSLPPQKGWKRIGKPSAFSKVSSWVKGQFKRRGKKTGTSPPGKRDDGDGEYDRDL